MDLKELGEFGLIARIKSRFRDSLAKGVEGIGDDCAVIPLNDVSSYVVTTDLLVEGRHFLMDRISPFELGYKSLAVNISDVAAMGAAPRFSFLSLALPSEVCGEWCEQFLEGYHALSSQFSVALLGGDTTAAENGHMVISVTAIGQVENQNIKRRSGARRGDIIAVTKQLGDSSLALRMILDGDDISKDLRAKHNTPLPHINEGIWLGARKEVHAMMDISDGVASDMEHICELSGCGARIFIDKIPQSDVLEKICAEHGWSALDFSLSGGEDYGLLLTVDSEAFECLQREFFGKLYAIGVITDGDSVVYMDSAGVPMAQKKGFRHF
ncbi:MAG: thiamine-phosphate kinase [Rikenellaceae bacterium]